MPKSYHLFFVFILNYFLLKLKFTQAITSLIETPISNFTLSNSYSRTSPDPDAFYY